ncbi:response regulator transcription factor [Elusimicrobiota bacterium]
MSKINILLVEDDRNVRDLVRAALEQERYRIFEAGSVMEGRRVVEKAKPDLLILDRNLPDFDGLDFCHELRARPETRSLPILFLTAKKGLADKVLGLRMGGDDYLTKPFKVEELVGRVAALLRRTQQAPQEEDTALVHGPIRLIPGERDAFLDGKKLKLTRTEFDLLETFVRKPRQVLTRQNLLASVWGYGIEASVTTKAVDMVVMGLRKKLGKRGKLIDSVRGFGYRLKSLDEL